MCHSNCPYERGNGSCMGQSMFAVKKLQPHCMDDEDFDAFVEDYEDPRIMEYEYDRMSTCSSC